MADPVRLIELLAEIGRLYATLRQERDRESVKALGEKLLALRNRINDILETLDVVNDNGNLDSRRLDQWDVEGMPDDWRREKIRNVDRQVVIEESGELADFFANVSNSLIDAQKDLNSFSKTYVDQLTDARVQPTYFSIPSLRAEMKLGFSELTSRGINVILFKSEEQKKRYVESTVTFELVSTPPVSTTPPVTNTPLSLPTSPPPGETTEAGFPATVGSLPDFPTTFEMAERAEEELRRVRGVEKRAEPAEVQEEGREEDADELLKSLRAARAALFAATDRLVGARKNFAERAEAGSRKAEAPLVTGEERASVLDLIVGAHEKRGTKREDIFENSRGEAVVLKYTLEGVTRYLLLWPGRPQDSKRRERSEVRVYDLAVRKGELKIDGSVFGNAPEEGYLTVGSKGKLLRLKKDEMADLAAALGDTLVIITTVFREWLEDLSRQD